MRLPKILTIGWLLLFLLETTAGAQELSSYDKEHYNLKKGLAIQGYDPVAYFTENKAVRGTEKHSFKTEKGITYLFASEANKEAFEKDPQKYEPQYGGYCAYAMAYGDKVKIDPGTYKITNGKLFLFYNFGRTNTLLKWNKEEEKLLADANIKWSEIIDK